MSAMEIAGIECALEEFRRIYGKLGRKCAENRSLHTLFPDNLD